MEELTFEEFCSKPMQLVMHVSGSQEHYLHRFNAEIGVAKVVVTKVKKHGGFGKSSTIYLLDYDTRTFTTADEVYLAYMEKACGVKA